VRQGGAAPAAKSPAESKDAIEWLDWGSEAFRKAILRDRPILLNVVVSWAPTCREMEKTWNDPRVALLVNQGYVPIRVDADRRPDIRERYATSSWPSITLLLPNGLPFFALREEGKEPSRVTLGLTTPERLVPVLREALNFFNDKSKRGALRKTVEEGWKTEAEPKFEPAALDPALPAKIFETLRSNFDALHGSWTKQPKFLMPAPIEACLFDYSQTRNPKALEVADRALMSILEGGMYDKSGGGIFRLSTEEDWSHPEYEKLLDRNVAFLDALLSGYVLTGKQMYASSANETIVFLQSTLRRKGGGYYASQGSDPSSPDGGAYYRASLEARAKLKPPPVDSIVLTGWSAKAAAAELRAAAVLHKREWIGPSRETLDWLIANAYEPGRGVVHGIDNGRKYLPAFLEDQVLFSEGMLDAFESTGEKAYLRAARDTAAFALQNLRDPAAGLFGDLIPNPADPMLPFRKARHPYDWNCRMARLLARLFYMNPKDKALKSAASSILEAYTKGYEKGPNSGLYAMAESEYREGPLWIWVVGNRAIPGYETLLAMAQETPQLWTLVVSLDPADPADAKTKESLGLVVRPPTLYFAKGTHTSKGAILPEEVTPSYRSLMDQLAEEKAKALEKASGQEDKPPQTPPAPPPPQPPAAGQGNAPSPPGAGPR
jgi:uncharacterized protein YyaL (SSP411 family)